MRTNRHAGLWAVLFAAAGASYPHAAAACGGTFCDSGPRAMPVDQTGENILFVLSADKVEAHIQIQYKGEASRFAWVVPVPALPEFEIGSQQLFANLLAGTVPTYGFTTSRDTCGIQPRGGPTSLSGGFDSSENSHTGPTVVLKQTVGALDVTVLQGGTAEEVAGWLNTNGYRMPDNAPALMQGYVAQRFMFIAVKLTGGAGVDEIHPLVVRYMGTEPCVPLKLTSVAAVDNMGIRTFFLGDERVVPKSYKHITLNPVRIDWLNFAPNYNDVVSHAADSPVANGKAFVTEYAGPSTVVARFGLVDSRWNAAPFVTADPGTVPMLLAQQGLMSCAAAACTYTNPLVLPLLRQYLPAPPGVPEGAFYGCTGCYAAQIDHAAWNGMSFAKDFDQRIVLPARHADDLLVANGYLTRMFTTISPAEMTEDPTFMKMPGLPVVAAAQMAARRIFCSNGSVMTLPDGREVALPQAATTWPNFADDMPWAERIEDFGGGTSVKLVDNGETINGGLGAWNESQGYPPKSCSCQLPGAPAPGGAAVALGGVVAALAAGRRRRRSLDGDLTARLTSRVR
jgi:MYXO-CTERM domain-containing protein